MLGFIFVLFFALIISLLSVMLEKICEPTPVEPAYNEQQNVRQTPVYTIASDPRGNDTTSNFTDFFWNVSSQNNRSNEPSKDDKDLPTYEEVMRMEMVRQVNDSAIQPPITAPTNTVEIVPPVRLPV